MNSLSLCLEILHAQLAQPVFGPVQSVHPPAREASPLQRLSLCALQSVERVLAGMAQQEECGHLRWVRVQQGESVQLVPVDEISYFKSSDKYTVVRTTSDEHLIRKPIKALVRELDPDLFWQIHRGTVVNVSCIAGVSRSLTGRGVIRLKNLSETLTVSQPYMHRFKQM